MGASMGVIGFVTYRRWMCGAQRGANRYNPENRTYGSSVNDLPRMTLLDLLEDFKAQQIARGSLRPSSRRGSGRGVEGGCEPAGADALHARLQGLK